MYALNRERMAQVGFGGPDGVGRTLLFPVVPEHPFFPSDLSVGQDIDKAKSLLASAGLEGGFSATMISPDFTYFSAIATLAQQDLAEIGIDIDLAILDISTLIDRAFSQKDFDLCVLGNALDPELAAVLEPMLGSEGDSNYFGYSNPDVDAALRRGRMTFDDAERAAAYHEVLDLAVIQDAALITVTNEPLINVYRNTTNGNDYKPDPLAIWHWPVASTTA
jgi:peptide/nickel transport system substrate-binding protein